MNLCADTSAAIWKKITTLVITALIGAVIGAVVVQLTQGKTIREDLASQLEGHFLRLDRNAAKGRVVFLGSSTLQGLDVSRVTPIGLNLAVGGEFVQRLARRSKGYKSVRSARAIVMNIGFNDFMSNCKVDLGDWSALFHEIPNTIPIVVVGIQGAAESRIPAGCAASFSKLIEDYNQFIRQECEKRLSCRFIPNPIPANAASVGVEAFQDHDGIHLSPAGYDLLTAQIIEKLSELEVPIVTIDAVKP